jgi:hypothetical protein
MAIILDELGLMLSIRPRPTRGNGSLLCATNEATVAAVAKSEPSDILGCGMELPCMNAARTRGAILMRILLLAAASLCGGVCRAQSQVPAHTEESRPAPSVTADFGSAPEPERSYTHRFWDRTNGWLFAGVGASRTLDYFSTLNMRRRGRQEIFLSNDAVDNHAGFAGIEAAATGVSVGASYLFHRYGHHRLERWTSIVHLSLATTGAVRNYCLKTAH